MGVVLLHAFKNDGHKQHIFYDKQHHTPQQSLILMRSLLSSRMSLASSFALTSPCLWPCHRHCLWHFRSASHLALSSLLSFGFVFALYEKHAGTPTREANSVATTWKIHVSRESVRSFPTPFPPAHCLITKQIILEPSRNFFSNFHLDPWGSGVPHGFSNFHLNPWGPAHSENAPRRLHAEERFPRFLGNPGVTN